MNKISAAILAACSIGMIAQAQVIDPLNGDSLSGYTYYLVNDSSHGTGGDGVSFSDSSGALVESFAGTINDAEQALFLAPASSFSTTFSVGDTLLVYSTVPASSTTEDFGLAVSASNPSAETGAGDGYSSRSSFDWMSISVRPNGSGGTIRQNTSISGTLTTASDNLTATLPVDALFITWNSADSFTLGYISDTDTVVDDDTVTFGATSTIGAEIGFYGDIRTTGTSIGSFDNLSIEEAPEPTSAALLGLGGLLGVGGLIRRKK